MLRCETGKWEQPKEPPNGRVEGGAGCVKGKINRAAFSFILYSIIKNQGDIKLAYQSPGIGIPEGSSGRYIEVGTKKMHARRIQLKVETSVYCHIFL